MEIHDLAVIYGLNYINWQIELCILRINVPKKCSEEDIKEMVLIPRRGVWFEKVLNFWTKVLNIEIDQEVYRKAIFRIAPIAK